MKKHPNKQTVELEKELTTIIEGDAWMMDVLDIIKNRNLNDCWIGAGFVRNKIWDHKHEMSRTPLNDIDIIYFDSENADKIDELRIEKELKKQHPSFNWSVKNQARMHLRNGHHPYQSCNESISFWPETATSVAVRLDSKNQIESIAPHGLADLFDLIVRPTPQFKLSIYQERIEKKQWILQWPHLIIRDQKA